MTEFINELMQNETVASILALLSTLDITALIGIAIAWLKEKAKSNKLAVQVQEVLAKNNVQLNNDNLQKLTVIENKIDARLDEMLAKIETKLELDKEEKKAQVTANTLKLQELIKQVASEVTEEKQEVGE